MEWFRIFSRILLQSIMAKSTWSLPDRPSTQVSWLHRRPAARQYDLLSRVYVAALSGILLVSLCSVSNLREFPFSYLLLTLNGALAAYGQHCALRANSAMHLASFLFSYLFMSVIPIQQFGEGLDPVFYVSNVAVLACVSALIFTTCGILSLVNWRAASPATPDASAEPVWEFHNYLFLSVPVVVTAALSVALFGRSLFTSREGFGFALATVFSDPATAGAVSNFLLQVPFFGAVMGLRAAMTTRHRGWTWFYASLALCAVAINNPLDTARFKLAGLAFFFIEYFFRGRKLKLLIVAMVLGFSLAPLFHIFRYENSASNETAYGSKYLSTDFDAFQMACYTLIAVDQAGVSYGSNIAGAILFFVPRSLWPNKPEPTPFEIFYTAQQFRPQGTNNLSDALFTEGYFAFSWFGVILISGLYWWSLTAVQRRSLRDANSLWFLTRSILVGLVLIILRGPLITATTNIVANLTAAVLPWCAMRMFRPARAAAGSGRA